MTEWKWDENGLSPGTLDPNRAQACDFCQDASQMNDAVWSYPCEDFEMLAFSAISNADEISEGPWVACPDHWMMIELGLPALLSCADNQATRQTWAQFWRHRTGPPSLISDLPPHEQAFELILKPNGRTEIRQKTREL